MQQWDDIQRSAMPSNRTLSLWRKWKWSWFQWYPILVSDWQIRYFQRQRKWNIESYHFFESRKMGHLHCCGSILIKWRCKQMQHNAICARKRQNGCVWFAWSIILCFPIRHRMDYPVAGIFMIKITIVLQGVITIFMVFFVTTANHPLKQQQNKIRGWLQTYWKILKKKMPWESNNSLNLFVTV